MSQYSVTTLSTYRVASIWLLCDEDPCIFHVLTHNLYRLLAVYSKLKNVGLAFATSSEDEQNALVDEAKSLILDICNDHVFAAEAFVKDPSLRESLARKIEAECHELIEYIVAAKRFNLEINARSKDRVISFGERLACLYMTVLLQDTVCGEHCGSAIPVFCLLFSCCSPVHLLVAFVTC